MKLRFTAFDDLDTRTLYTLMQLRVDVFVVEQACPYSELDGRDLHHKTVHVLGYMNSELMACARILESETFDTNTPTIRLDPLRIGRVLVAEGYRGRGYARSLMEAIIQRIQTYHPHRPVQLSAQTAVQGFYKSLGFEPVSATYLEDGIEHIDMQLQS